MYNIIWDILIKQYLHLSGRKPKFLALIKVLISNVTDLHLKLLDFIAVKRVELGFNYQTIMMEYMLNFYWPIANGLIYIEDTNRYNGPLYMFDIEDGQTSITMFDQEDVRPTQYANTPPVYMYDIEDVNDGYDFIVWVPAGLIVLSTDEAIIRKQVNRYKIPGKRYTVQTYP